MKAVATAAMAFNGVNAVAMENEEWDVAQPDNVLAEFEYTIEI